MGPVEHLGTDSEQISKRAWFATTAGFPMKNGTPSPRFLLLLHSLLSRSQGKSTEPLPTTTSLQHLGGLLSPEP